ncbi:MAG: hypothetical protein ABII18_00575 [bacterium]|nr:hypothetical protein [bacterium]MBU1916864.1 hypothetical protein [bacterium]
MKQKIFMLLVLGVFLVISADGFAKPHHKKNPNAKVDTRWEVKADKNNDGVVNPQEYKKASHSGKIDTPAERRVDANHDGTIDKREVQYSEGKKRKYLKKKSQTDQPWEQKADKNNDGHVDKKEVKKWNKKNKS